MTIEQLALTHTIMKEALDALNERGEECFGLTAKITTRRGAVEARWNVSLDVFGNVTVQRQS